MATWIVGGALAIIVGAIVFKMVRDKRNGKADAAATAADAADAAAAGHEQAK